MKGRQKFKFRPQLLTALAFIGAFVFSALPTPQVLAANDAYFSLSPYSSSQTVGSSFTLTVTETSTSGDQTNSVQANLTYNGSLLQYTGMSYGAFTGCAAPSGGGGSISIPCAYLAPPLPAPNYLTGTQVVAYISFKVLASGSTTVNLVSSSNIDNTGGSSVWDGVTKSASYSLSAASSGSSSAPKSNTSSSTKTTTPSPTPAPAPNPTSKPTTTQQSGTNTQQDNAAVTIIVMDTNGQPVANAKVVLDNSTVMYTNSQGKANFSVESAGSHDVTVTAPGKKPYQTKVTLTANQSIPLELQLTSASSSGGLYAVIGIIGVLILLGVGFYFFRSKLPFLHKAQFTGASAAMQSPIVGYNSSRPTPMPQPVPVRPTTPSNGPQQRSSFGTDSVDGMRRRF